MSKEDPLPKERKMGITEKEKLSELLAQDLHRLRTDIATAEKRLKMEIETEIKAEWDLESVTAKHDKMLREFIAYRQKMCDIFGHDEVPRFQDILNRHIGEPSMFQLEVEKRMGERNGAILQMDEAVADARKQIYLADLGPKVQAIFDNVRSAAKTLALEAKKKAPVKRLPRRKPKI